MVVEKRISSTETMMDGSLDRYLDVGQSAIRAIEKLINREDISRILDLPCGHGRVARHLKARYPLAKLYVSDLDDDGATFCAQALGGLKLPSHENFDGLDFKMKFDLIWVGSLITHLPMKNTISVLKFLKRHLVRHNGVAIVSSHGAFAAGRIFARGEALYGLMVQEEQKILEDYFSMGYGFHRYPHSQNYGISLISREWIFEQALAVGLKLVSFDDHAWDHHQDVFGLRLE
jgi:SAM-dependent methyltransferase